jgi:hypothetical protein
MPVRLLPAGAGALTPVPAAVSGEASCRTPACHLKFFGDHAALADAQAFAAYLAPLRRAEGVVFANRPFGGPKAVLAYLSRNTHRVAIANSRLISIVQVFRMPGWRDYPCAPGAGVGKAPRHEIAVGEARTVQRALWEFGGVVRYVVA